jgi:hypothetical protein
MGRARHGCLLVITGGRRAEACVTGSVWVMRAQYFCAQSMCCGGSAGGIIWEFCESLRQQTFLNPLLVTCALDALVMSTYRVSWSELLLLVLANPS